MASLLSFLLHAPKPPTLVMDLNIWLFFIPCSISQCPNLSTGRCQETIIKGGNKGEVTAHPHAPAFSSRILSPPAVSGRREKHPALKDEKGRINFKEGEDDDLPRIWLSNNEVSCSGAA